MIKANNEKIGRNLDTAVGGLTNESRFYAKETIRERKILRVPALTGGLIVIEQGWNKVSKNKDVVKLTVKKNNNKSICIFNRIDIEQAILAMSQGNETIKYVKASARSQRKYAEQQ